jgi:hypothetical protein
MSHQKLFWLKKIILNIKWRAGAGCVAPAYHYSPLWDFKPQCVTTRRGHTDYSHKPRWPLKRRGQEKKKLKTTFLSKPNLNSDKFGQFLSCISDMPPIRISSNLRLRLLIIQTLMWSWSAQVNGGLVIWYLFGQVWSINDLSHLLSKLLTIQTTK